MTNCALSDEWFCNLGHGNCSLNPCFDTLVLQNFLQHQSIHYSCEHAYIIGSSLVHSPLGSLDSTKDVAATNHDCNLNFSQICMSYFISNAFDCYWIDTEFLIPHEGFATELQQ